MLNSRILTDELGTTEIALITLVVLLAVVFAIFFLLYFWYSFLNNRLKKIKQRFNELSASNVYSSLQYLQSLSNNNDQLKQVLDKLVEINKFYQAQLQTLKKNIMALTSYHRSFKFILVHKMSKKTIDDLTRCYQLNGIIYDLYNHSTSYTQEAADLLAEFRITYDQIKSFFITNLPDNQHHEAFVAFVNRLSNLITNSNDYQINLDHEKLSETINLINENNNNFAKLVNTAYVYNKAFFYLKRKQRDLDKNIKENLDLLHKKEITEILRVQANVQHQLEDLKSNLLNLNVDKANHLIVLVSEMIEPAVNIFQQNDYINLLIDNSIDFLSKTFESLFLSIDNLNKAFEQIRNYFNHYNNDEIENDLNNAFDEIRKMRMNYEQLLNQKNNSQYFERIAFIKDLIELIKSLKNWQKSTTKICNSILDKHEAAINLINDVYELKLLLNQFYLLSQENTSHNVKKLTVINNDLELLKKIDTLVTENYVCNFKVARDYLDQIKEDVKSLYDSHIMNKTLKLYAKHLIFFANKYRFEDENIYKSIDHAQELYNLEQYEHAIDHLLTTLEHVKGSAKANKIKFN